MLSMGEESRRAADKEERKGGVKLRRTAGSKTEGRVKRRRADQGARSKVLRCKLHLTKG